MLPAAAREFRGGTADSCSCCRTSEGTTVASTGLARAQLQRHGHGKLSTPAPATGLLAVAAEHGPSSHRGWSGIKSRGAPASTRPGVYRRAGEASCVHPRSRMAKACLQGSACSATRAQHTHRAKPACKESECARALVECDWESKHHAQKRLNTTGRVFVRASRSTLLDALGHAGRIAPGPARKQWNA